MPEKNSTTSTERQVSSLGGVLNVDSTTLWAPERSEPVIHTSTSGSELAFALSCVQDPSGSEIHIFVPETSKDPLNRSALLARLVCHVLVARMPDQGLPDLCESIGDIYSFYRDRSASHSPLLTQRQEVRAKLGHAYERPEFEIAEE